MCKLTDITNYRSSQSRLDTEPKADSGDVVYEECEVYFDAEGNKTGIEIGVFKPDGSYLDPDKDCVAYEKQLKAKLDE